MGSALAMPPIATWHPLVALALGEDIGAGDITTNMVISADAEGRARIEAREALVVCGLDVGEEVFREVDPRVAYRRCCADGDVVDAGALLVQLEGPFRPILVGERTALNFLGRLCGIASLTRRFLEAVSGTRTRIVDTRKTLPGWRMLDKYAVAVGGGDNHRVGLFDGILLKDNHIAAAGGVAAATKAARAAAPANLRVQVEVQNAAEVAEAHAAGADFLLLDNFSADDVAAVVAEWDDRLLLEASGGIHLGNVRAYAEAGVHRISIGALTHSATACDVALEVDDDPAVPSRSETTEPPAGEEPGTRAGGRAR